MSDLAQAFFALIGLVIAVGCCGGSFAFGACLVCRWMEWSPVNTTINVFTETAQGEQK
jgi:hypothetical protein